MKRNTAFVLAAVLAAGLVYSSGCSRHAPQPLDAAKAATFEARLDSLVPRLLAEYGVPALAIGSVENGKVHFARGYGVADSAANRPATAKTLFNLASISKSVTTWGVLHLADSGLIDLDAPVHTYIQRWRLPASDFDETGVTVRRLLSHTAGLSVPTVPWLPADTTLPSLEEFLAGGAGSSGPVIIDDEPGNRWRYSGGGYVVLQLMIEEVTGQRFEEYMRQAVFEPLGMPSATFAPIRVSGDGIATPYQGDNGPIAPYRIIGGSAGGLYSNIEDFARFLTTYYVVGGAVISERLFETMLTPVMKVELEGVDLEGAEYALGHGVHRTRTGEIIAYHSGGNPGYLAYFLIAPATGSGLVLASNGSNAVPIIKEILEIWSDHYELDLQPVF